MSSSLVAIKEILAPSNWRRASMEPDILTSTVLFDQVLQVGRSWLIPPPERSWRIHVQDADDLAGEWFTKIAKQRKTQWVRKKKEWVRHSERQWETVVRHSGETQWWDTVVRHSGETQWWDTVVRHSGEPQWWDTVVRHSGEPQWDTVRHSETRWDTVRHGETQWATVSHSEAQSATVRHRERHSERHRERHSKTQ